MLTRSFIALCLMILSFNLHSKNTLEDFFDVSGYVEVKISPGGQFYSITYNEDTEVKLVILEKDTGKTTAAFSFGEYQKIQTVTWLNDERFMMSVAKTVGYLDTKGSRPYYVAANFDGSNRREILFSNTSFINIISILPNDKENILVTKGHYNDDFAVKVHKLNIYNGKMDYVAGQPKEDVFGITTDISGNPRIAFSYKEDKEQELGKGDLKAYFRKTVKSEWQSLDLKKLNYNKGDRLNFLGMNLKGNKAFILNDSGRKTIAIYALDLVNEELSLLAANDSVNITDAIFGPQGNVIGVTFDPDYPQYKYFDSNDENAIYKSLSDTFKNYRLEFTSHSKSKNLAVFKVEADTTPTTFYLYDIEKKQASFIASSSPEIDKKSLSTMEPFKIKARDGVDLSGYLTIPKGLADKNLPTIVVAHGGPHGPRDFWGYNKEVQYIASLGYAVIQINFRGSGGYGNEFEKSGYKKWGREMQDDVTDATYWAINQGITDKNRICIYGGSYGGYAALMGVVREPDLYKCAIGYVGVYSIPEMKKSGDIPTRESGRKYLDMVHGTDLEDMQNRSPSFNVDKIKAKLFIAHGKDDVRVPMEQYEALTNELDRISYPYESMVRDEGHGYHKPKNRTEFYTKMAVFFEENLNK
ncbi:S9 family peptidase [Pseudoalteromonas sp. NZS100]|uniref:alpha/beta hydrolase family protein n=1 Tax=Pseudoalteromonas sp. NZS100 TaxID=2792046 RepID=UPI0018CCF187|nr:S9 family peptidase [Pseudoalteromonas sp. NZS100]MBH0069766.1 S9 family peptidase [Pseudoalteromonas sp. NZS100]